MFTRCNAGLDTPNEFNLGGDFHRRKKLHSPSGFLWSYDPLAGFWNLLPIFAHSANVQLDRTLNSPKGRIKSFPGGYATRQVRYRCSPIAT